VTPHDANHRLRIRAASAQSAGEYALAADLRGVISVIEQLLLERTFARKPQPAAAK